VLHQIFLTNISCVRCRYVSLSVYFYINLL